MAIDLILMAEPRTVLGKKNKALRRTGMVPGVVYGPAVESTIQVSVNRREIEKFFTLHGHSTLFTLKWEGGEQQVFIKEVQVEPVRRAPLHVDFFAPNLKKALTAKVPVVLVNLDDHAEGVLTHMLDEIEVSALPTSMPIQIEADASGLKHAHDAIRAGDIQLPAGVTLVTDPDAMVASLIAERVQSAEDEEVETEAPAAADAEAPAESESEG